MKSQPRARFGIPFLVVAISGILTGCTASKVQPWERGTLASYPMRPDRDPQGSTMSEHIWFSREATAGGHGVGGSGCGCN